jgi:ABC-type antimicrobial peptide transport system permease subunit
VAESLLLGAAGAALGVGATQLGLHALNGARGQTLLGLAHLELLPRVAASGVAVALALGVAAGAMPAWGAYRAKVTDLLRST